MDPAVIIFLVAVLLIALMRWSLARRDGFTFWTNRPLIGWAAYNARRDAAVAAANAEEEHAAACLAALTPLDVEILTGLGWEPPMEVRDRVRRERREAERRRRAAEKSAAYVPMTPEELEAYKRRPAAVRQAEANENITGDPTIHPKRTRPSDYVDAHTTIATSLGISTADLTGWDALHVYISPDGVNVCHPSDSLNPFAY